MYKSILKLIWKRKGKTSLMVIEMFISFLILFALLTGIINYVYQYLESTGFDEKNVWVAELKYDKKTDDSGRTQRELMDLTKKNLLAVSGVKAVSNCSNNLPYEMYTTRSSMKYGETQHSNINILRTDENFQDALGLNVSKGNWYSSSDLALKEIPIVVNKEFKELFFESENAVGKTMTTGYNSARFRIVGYIDNFKIDGELSKKGPVCFRMIGNGQISNRMVIKTDTNVGKAIEEQLLNALTSSVKEWQVNFKSMDVYKKADFKRKLVPLLVFLSVAAFLIINIILGLFGTLLYNINQRKSEIGLRRSLGAPAIKIYQQFIGEMIMLTTLGVIPAIIITLQFPILKVFDISTMVYISAIFVSASIIYLLVFVGSFIPSRYAGKTEPAIALHEE